MSLGPLIRPPAATPTVKPGATANGIGRDAHGIPKAPIDLARARKECRDAILGNVPFHTDAFAAPIPVPEVTVIEAGCACIPGYFLCEACA